MIRTIPADINHYSYGWKPILYPLVKSRHRTTWKDPPWLRRPCCGAFGAPCVGGAWTSSWPIDALMKAVKSRSGDETHMA